MVLRPTHVVLGIGVLAGVLSTLTVAFVLILSWEDKAGSPALADADDAQADSGLPVGEPQEAAAGKPMPVAPSRQRATPSPAGGHPMKVASQPPAAATPTIYHSGLPVDYSRPYEPSSPLDEAIERLSEADEIEQQAELRREYEAQYGTDGGDYTLDSPAEDARREEFYGRVGQQVHQLVRSKVRPLSLNIERTAKCYDPHPNDGRRTLVLTEESKAELLELLSGHLDIDADPLPAGLAWNTMLGHFPPEVWAEQASSFRFEPDERYRAYAQGRPGAVQPAAIVEDRSFQAMLVKTYHLRNACRRLAELTRPVPAAEELLRWRSTLAGDDRSYAERDLLVYRINTALHTGRFDEAIQLAWAEEAREEDAWGAIVAFPEPAPWMAALGRLVQDGIEKNVHNLDGLQALNEQLELIGELAEGQGNRPIEESLVALQADVATAVTAEEASLAALNYRSIHDAAANNDVEDVKRHLARGVDINARGATTRRDRKGAKPLYSAAWHGHPEMVRFLLDHGADVEAGQSDGFNVLMAVTDPDPAEGQSLEDWLAVAKLLLDHGADPNVTNQLVGTPLHRLAAVADDSDDEIEYYLGLAEMLIDAGADVNAPFPAPAEGIRKASLGGRTPLHFAVLDRDMRMVEVLLKHGADANAQDGGGVTPMDCALLRSSGARDPLAQMLRRAGGRPSGNRRRR
jgi:hypothetical protein